MTRRHISYFYCHVSRYLTEAERVDLGSSFQRYQATVVGGYGREEHNTEAQVAVMKKERTGRGERTCGCCSGLLFRLVQASRLWMVPSMFIVGLPLNQSLEVTDTPISQAIQNPSTLPMKTNHYRCALSAPLVLFPLLPEPSRPLAPSLISFCVLPVR